LLLNRLINLVYSALVIHLILAWNTSIYQCNNKIMWICWKLLLA
jgi:hypothetical protein